MSAVTGEIMVRGAGDNFHEYNWRTDTWRDVEDNSNFKNIFINPLLLKKNYSYLTKN